MIRIYYHYAIIDLLFQFMSQFSTIFVECVLIVSGKKREKDTRDELNHSTI